MILIIRHSRKQAEEYKKRFEELGYTAEYQEKFPNGLGYYYAKTEDGNRGSLRSFTDDPESVIEELKKKS